MSFLLYKHLTHNYDEPLLSCMLFLKINPVYKVYKKLFKKREKYTCLNASKIMPPFLETMQYFKNKLFLSQ